jgi:hypothetical protein
MTTITKILQTSELTPIQVRQAQRLIQGLLSRSGSPPAVDTEADLDEKFGAVPFSADELPATNPLPGITVRGILSTLGINLAARFAVEVFIQRLLNETKRPLVTSITQPIEPEEAWKIMGVTQLGSRAAVMLGIKPEDMYGHPPAEPPPVPTGPPNVITGPVTRLEVQPPGAP